jgi:hypothetical protein
MRASRLGSRAVVTVLVVTVVTLLVLSSLVLVACGDSGGSSSSASSSGGSTGGVEDSNLDTANAVEAQVTVAKGGAVEAQGADGATAAIAFPAGAVAQDMTVVVTPLKQPLTDKGAPLTPGFAVVQKGNENEHLALASPAIVTFTLSGKVSKKAKVVNFKDASSAEAIPSSIGRQGGTTTVTAWVSSFSPVTVDDDPQDPLAPLVEPDRWQLVIDDTDVRDVQGATMSTKMSGTLTSNLMFSNMKGPISGSIKVDLETEQVIANLTSTEVTGKAVLTHSWIQVTDKKKGTFLLWGSGKVTFGGQASVTGTASGSFGTASGSASGSKATTAQMTVKTGQLPKVGGTANAIVKITGGNGATGSFEATITRMKE